MKIFRELVIIFIKDMSWNGVGIRLIEVGGV